MKKLKIDSCVLVLMPRQPHHGMRLCVVQLDTKWAKDPGFVLYDYTKPQDIPETLRGTFDMVVVDPPFVTRQARLVLRIRIPVKV